MSRSNLLIITNSARLANLVNEIETPSAEMGQSLLQLLNNMLSRWKRQHGIDLGFYPQTSLAANIPIDDDYFDVVELKLADKAAGNYGVSLSQDVKDDAANAWNGLLSEFIAPEPADMSHLPGVGRRRWSIDTDT